MLSYLDMNMSCRLHLHAMIKCAYIHDDVISHTLHRLWDYELHLMFMIFLIRDR